MAFFFPQRLSTFLNGFPIFLNGFPHSEKSKKIYLRWQVSKRSLFELRISRYSLSKLCNFCYNVYISLNKRQHNNGNNTSATRVMMPTTPKVPVQQWQCHHPNYGKNASATMATMPSQ
jgi:hypothetical protein